MDSGIEELCCTENPNLEILSQVGTVHFAKYINSHNHLMVNHLMITLNRKQCENKKK